MIPSGRVQAQDTLQGAPLRGWPGDAYPTVLWDGGPSRGREFARTGSPNDDLADVLVVASPPQICRNLGSSRSRSQSPRRLTASTVSSMARPGKSEIHQAVARKPRPSA